MIEHVFEEKPVSILSNGRVSAMTAHIALDRTRIKWFVPRCLKAPLEARMAQMTPEEIDDADAIEGHSVWMRDLMGFTDEGSAFFELAVGYRYPAETVELLPDEQAVFNKDLESEPEGLEEANEERQVEGFRNLPFYAAVFDGNKIVSRCSHKGNGTVSIGADEAYRNRGYASSCLRVVTDRSLKAGIEMGYGTSFENAAARATAERCGYELNNLSYWVSITGDYYPKLPEDVRADLEHRA